MTAVQGPSPSTWQGRTGTLKANLLLPRSTASPPISISLTSSSKLVKPSVCYLLTPQGRDSPTIHCPASWCLAPRHQLSKHLKGSLESKLLSNGTANAFLPPASSL